MPPESTPQKQGHSGLKTIETFESDVAEILEKDNVTKASIALAENKRAVERADAARPPAPLSSKPMNLPTALPEQSSSRNIPWRLIGIIGGILVVIGIGALVYFGIGRAGGASTATPQPGTPTKAAESGVSLTADDTRAAVIDKLRKAVDAAQVQVNDVKEIPVLLGFQPIHTDELLTMLETKAPASLARALDPQVTLGVHAFRGATPFLLIPVTSYDYAFTGMLSWEKTMLGDIGPLFGVNVQELSLGAGTSTAQMLAQDLTLKDAIIRNKDVRALFDQNGAIIFLYSFLDKQTLLITTNETTLQTLINKVSRGRLKLPEKQ